MPDNSSETQLVFSRRNGWLPSVLRVDGHLRLKVVGGADALHDPREFSFPIQQSHLEVIRNDLGRHLLLLGKLLPLCYAAGIRGAIDEAAAVALLDPILLGTPDKVDALCAHERSVESQLVAHGADISLIERGEVFAASRSVTDATDWQRVREYDAGRQRAERGIILAPLDTAILQYTGQLIHGATIPRRLPDAVEAAPLTDVLDVIATAERACADLLIGCDPRRGRDSTDEEAWKEVERAVRDAVDGARPRLAEDTLRSVAFLMCSEVARRTGRVPIAHGDVPEGTVTIEPRALTFSDDKGAEQRWNPGDAGDAEAAFWEFVADRAAQDNEVFMLEAQDQGEGVQLQLYADALARVTTDSSGADRTYRVEYTLVDALSGYRALVSTFVRGGCAALEPLGPWIADVEELERARRAFALSDAARA